MHFSTGVPLMLSGLNRLNKGSSFGTLVSLEILNLPRLGPIQNDITKKQIKQFTIKKMFYYLCEKSFSVNVLNITQHINGQFKTNPFIKML